VTTEDPDYDLTPAEADFPWVKTVAGNVVTDLGLQVSRKILAGPMRSLFTITRYPPELAKLLLNYDIIHAYTMMPILAHFVDRPFVAQSTGSDLRSFAWSKPILARLLRSGYAKAEALIFTQPDLIELASRACPGGARFIPQHVPVGDRVATVSDRSSFDVFHPTRLDFSTKGNDSLLHGFSKVIKKQPRARLHLVSHGTDNGKAAELCKHLGLDQFVVWHPPMTPTEMTRAYLACDCVADQFSIVSLGLISLEAMALGLPVVCWINEDAYRSCYGETPPVTNARTADEIADALNNLVSPSERARFGAEAREWLQKHHGPETVTSKLVAVYEDV